MRDVLGEQGLFEPLTRVVDKFVKAIPVGAQPLCKQVQGHSLKSVGDERGSLPRRELVVDEPRQEGPRFPLLKTAFRSWIFDRPAWQSLPKLSSFDGRLSPPAPAQLPEHDPDGDRKGPGHKLTFATEAIEFRLNDEDGLLCTIFGQVPGFLGLQGPLDDVMFAQVSPDRPEQSVSKLRHG